MRASLLAATLLLGVWTSSSWGSLFHKTGVASPWGKSLVGGKGNNHLFGLVAARGGATVAAPEEETAEVTELYLPGLLEATVIKSALVRI